MIAVGDLSFGLITGMALQTLFFLALWRCAISLGNSAWTGGLTFVRGSLRC